MACAVTLMVRPVVSCRGTATSGICYVAVRDDTGRSRYGVMVPSPFISIAVVGAVLFAAPKTNPSKAATKVARTYFAALELRDLDRAESLFASVSSVFENGKSEGTWGEYRAHHLGPEIGNIKKFDIELQSHSAVHSADGTLAFVEWAIAYRVTLRSGRHLKRDAVVTFVVAKETNVYRIRHVHWSSRKGKRGGH